MTATAFDSINDPHLPPAVRRMARALRELWVETFNAAGQADECAAYKAAWKAVRTAMQDKQIAGQTPSLNRVWAGQEPAQEATMPWKVVEEDGRHCVYKMNDDGSLAEKLKCYDDRAEALAYQRALYANVEEKASKTDGGAEYSAGAYLYTPDKEQPSTWKLRIEETPGKVTVAQLGRAAAALGPGFRGNRVQMPADARRAAAKKLVGLYRSHDVAGGDIPDYLWEIAGMEGPKEKEMSEIDRADYLGRLRSVYGNETVKAWNEDAHPRHPEGDSRGGQFAPKDGAGEGEGDDDMPDGARSALAAARAGKPLTGFSEEDLRRAYLEVSLKNEPDTARALAAAQKREASASSANVSPAGDALPLPDYSKFAGGVTIPADLADLPRDKWLKLRNRLAKLELRKLRSLQTRVQADMSKEPVPDPRKETPRARYFGRLDELVTDAIDKHSFGRRSKEADADLPTLVSFKAFDQDDGRTRWVLVSSGGFEDRDREVVSTEFLRSCVGVADRSKERGPLLIFHVPGAKIGECDYQAVVGEPGFLLESGTFDDTEAGRRAAAYYKAHAKETGASIKFLYANRSPDGVYAPPGAILERSLMRRERAAFPWSALQLSEVAKMAKISREKREELEQVLGEDLAVQILDQLDANAEALKQAGIRAKAAAKPEEDEDEEEMTETEAAVPAEEDAEDEEPSDWSEEDEDEEEDEEEKAAKAAPTLDGGEYELVLTEDALNAVAEKAASTISTQLDQLAAQLKAALDDVKTLRTVVEKNAQDVQTLKLADETKIAEKVANLPRATVRRLEQGDLYRATQSKEAEVAKEGDDPTANDFLARLKKVVHD